MAQHLCIVARDKPLLLGYLNIVLEHLAANGDELQIVIDRRPDPLQLEDAVSPQSSVVPDQRHLRGVDELLRTQGYAIVSREDGVSWQLSDRGQEYVEELAPVDELAEEEAGRASGHRRTLFSALVVVAAVVGVMAALPRDSMYRLGDGLVGIAERGTSWMRSPVDVSPTASSPVPAAKDPAAKDNAAVTSPPRAPLAGTSPAPSPASVAALQAARASERAAIAIPRPPEPARPVETVRAVAPLPTVEPPRAAEAPRAIEAPRAVEPQRLMEPLRAADPPRTVAAARVVEPPRPADPPRSTPAPAAETAAATVARAELPARRNGARVEGAGPAKDEAVTATPAKPVEFSGVPRFEMSRERDAAGRTAAITVRVTDAGGRPLPSADVRILRQFSDGAVRETQLEAITPVGSYRGALPNSGPNTDGLVMRVLLGDRRFEVPLAE